MGTTVAELRREHFDKIIDPAFRETHSTYGVPRYLKRAETAALLERKLPVSSLYVFCVVFLT